MNYYSHIRQAIEEQVLSGEKEFIIYPFGEQGLLTKKILNEVFGIQEKCIIDNNLCGINSNINSISCLSKREYDKCIVLITSNNERIYNELRSEIKKYISSDRIVDIFKRSEEKEDSKPKVGKYSYGPLCNNSFVESIGAFCSFAALTDVVLNHAVSYISTHPFLYCRVKEANKGHIGDWYFDGVQAKGEMHKKKKVVIGNDVWLGRNVVITNGARIGNGVIGGAGAIITKDIPDYAVVVGIPARIIKYRYTQEQIIELNKINWWDWPDEKIRECYTDFYDDIEVFIKKHKVEI